MKIQVRYGTFETNSSSMHSLVLGTLQNKSYPKMDKVITFCEFGWGYDELRTPNQKLNYFATYFANYGGIDLALSESLSDHEIMNALCRHKHFQWAMDVICTKYGISKNDFSFEYESAYSPFGYIDHQSVETICEVLHDDETLFKGIFVVYLFGDSFVVIDNDNH